MSNKVWKALVKVFKPTGRALVVDLSNELKKVSLFDGKEKITTVISKMSNLICCLTTRGNVQNTIKTVTRLEDSILECFGVCIKAT